MEAEKMDAAAQAAKCRIAKENLVWEGKWLKMKEVHWVRAFTQFAA
jgi:hypothetical protein